MAEIIGSIINGAYGDCYEQLICLKNLVLTNPGTRLKLFFENPFFLNEFNVLDLSFSEGAHPWTDLMTEKVDRFHQYQVNNPELRADVIDKLPREVRARIDLRHNRKPWHDLRGLIPLEPRLRLGLSPLGKRRLPEVMQADGVRPEIFGGLTLGFLWRHRVGDSYVKPFLQRPADELRRRYSRAFRRLIDELGCTVLVCGMKVATTDENRERVQAKFPEFGLDLPPERSVHLKGLSWPLELEILAQGDLCLGHASGFTEGLYLRRGGRTLLLDPPPFYLLMMLKNRLPMFGLENPLAYFEQWLQPTGEGRIHRRAARALKRSARNRGLNI